MHTEEDLTCNFWIRRNHRRFTVILQCLWRHFEPLVLSYFELKTSIFKGKAITWEIPTISERLMGSLGYVSGMQWQRAPSSGALRALSCCFLVQNQLNQKHFCFGRETARAISCPACPRLALSRSSRHPGRPRAHSQVGTASLGTWPRTERAKQSSGQKFILRCTKLFQIQATAFLPIQIHLALTRVNGDRPLLGADSCPLNRLR